MAHDFEDIEVKENALALLEQKLQSKRKKCMIGTGAMTDPYIPIELQLCHVRKSLELVLKYGFGFTLQTKSARVLRDIDLLKKVNTKTKCVVQMTLTTADDELCRFLEPNVSVTSERVEALRTLKKAGIPTVVWLCPLLPFINDTVENVSKIIDYCHQVGVYGIINFGMGLTLREGNREYFYKNLDEFFPGLKQKYIKMYGDSYVVESPNSKILNEVFSGKCNEYNIVHDNEKIFKYLSTMPEIENEIQMTLF